MGFNNSLYKKTATLKTLKYSILSLAILGGPPVITYFFFKTEDKLEKQTIQDRIIKSKRTILPDGANTWGIKLHVYNSSPEIQHKVGATIKNLSDLRNLCKKTLTKESNDDDYSIAEKICTTPTNREKLQRFNWKIISEGDQTRWISKANLYKKSRDENIGINKQGEISWKEIKEWCKTTAEKEIKDGDNIYISTKRLCTHKNPIV